ncbi:hypothetical protein VF21_04720 [Pseudogymnoascus sp. 05NY08]|nr:hypothetical protein VF21_04720 [Pseudogymnoascus sp. 05NY08]
MSGNIEIDPEWEEGIIREDAPEVENGGLPEMIHILEFEMPSTLEVGRREGVIFHDGSPNFVSLAQMSSSQLESSLLEPPEDWQDWLGPNPTAPPISIDGANSVTSMRLGSVSDESMANKFPDEEHLIGINKRDSRLPPPKPAPELSDSTPSGSSVLMHTDDERISRPWRKIKDKDIVDQDDEITPAPPLWDEDPNYILPPPRQARTQGAFNPDPQARNTRTIRQRIASVRQTLREGVQEDREWIRGVMVRIGIRSEPDPGENERPIQIPAPAAEEPAPEKLSRGARIKARLTPYLSLRGGSGRRGSMFFLGDQSEDEDVTPIDLSQGNPPSGGQSQDNPRPGDQLQVNSRPSEQSQGNARPREQSQGSSRPGIQWLDTNRPREPSQESSRRGSQLQDNSRPSEQSQGNTRPREQSQDSPRPRTQWNSSRPRNRGQDNSRPSQQSQDSPRPRTQWNISRPRNRGQDNTRPREPSQESSRLGSQLQGNSRPSEQSQDNSRPRGQSQNSTPQREERHNSESTAISSPRPLLSPSRQLRPSFHDQSPRADDRLRRTEISERPPPPELRHSYQEQQEPLNQPPRGRPSEYTHPLARLAEFQNREQNSPQNQPTDDLGRVMYDRDPYPRPPSRRRRYREYDPRSGDVRQYRGVSSGSLGSNFMHSGRGQSVGQDGSQDERQPEIQNASQNVGQAVSRDTGQNGGQSDDQNAGQNADQNASPNEGQNEGQGIHRYVPDHLVEEYLAACADELAAERAAAQPRTRRRDRLPTLSRDTSKKVKEKMTKFATLGRRPKEPEPEPIGGVLEEHFTPSPQATPSAPPTNPPPPPNPLPVPVVASIQTGAPVPLVVEVPNAAPESGIRVSEQAYSTNSLTRGFKFNMWPFNRKKTNVSINF